MLLLKHLHILPMAGPGPMNGDILLENGKIRALGRELSAPGAQVLELEGLYAMPGMVDAHCHIGMWEDGNMIEGDDGNETSGPITPELRAIDAINPFDRCFAEACAAGVTACVTGPGSANVIGGQFAALKTRPGSVEDKLIQAPLAMKAALGENPKRVYAAQKSSPQTRMATAALLRRALLEAQAYAKKRAEKEGADFDMAKEALLPVLRGELPLKIHAHRADDILTAIRIAEEFHLRFSLEHCTEGYLIPEAIRQAQDAGAKVIIGPLLTDRSKV
ncbi:MAG TPA: amidohydrolase, partial [Candidatus Pelethousia gallinarum]|nr:amidohydrolase [Candidatus Pelethousia gallinarum]